MKQNFQRYLFFDILDSFWMGYFLVSYLKVLWYHDPGFDRLFDHSDRLISAKFETKFYSIPWVGFFMVVIK